MAAGYFPLRLISFLGAGTGLALLCQRLTQLAPPPNSEEISCNLNLNTHARAAGSRVSYSLHHSGMC